MNGEAQIAATSDEQKTTVVIAQDDDTKVIESQFEESKATVIETQVQNSEESPEVRMDEEPAEA